jgi:hypothetical protein
MASMASIGRHSLIRWQSLPDGPGDSPEAILEAVTRRLRDLNRTDGARELSIAITKIEEAQHWLRALAERKGQHDHDET